MPTGLRSLFTPWWKTLRAMSQSDAVIFGGGTLFTDAESVHACILWWLHVAVARMFGKPVLLAFQGIGPFHTWLGLRLARSAVRSSLFISVRDAESLERVRSFQPKSEPLLTADPAWLLFTPRGGELRDECIAIIPRRNPTPQFFERVFQLKKEHPNAPFVIISLQPNDERESQLCKKLSEELSANVVPVASAKELIDALMPCSRVLSQRYHGALAARAMGIACEEVAQARGDKLNSLKMADSIREREKAQQGMKSLLLFLGR